MTSQKRLQRLKTEVAAIKKQLGQHGEALCAKELKMINDHLDELHAVVKSAAQDQPSKQELAVLNQLLLALQKVILEVDKKMMNIETEVAGSKDAEHKKTRMQDHAHHHDFKSALSELIDRIKVDLPYV